MAQFYGPWIESHVHRNWILPQRPDVTGTLGPEVVLGDPLRDAECGWHFGSGSIDDGITLQRATASVTVPGSNPAPAAEMAWEEAWTDNLAPVTGSSGNGTRQRLDVNVGPILDLASAGWNLYAWSHTLRLLRGRGWDGPARELWPEGAVSLEIDDQTYRKLLSVTLLPYTPASTYFTGYYRDTPDRLTGWLQTVGSISGFTEMPTGFAEHSLDAAALQELADDLREANPGTGDIADSRMPSFAFIPTRPVSVNSDIDESFAASFELYVEFLGPPYRFIYDTPPVSPPRRIYPRDDGMTGGARRTWPPSKSQQWGNRVDGSGYV